LPFDDENLRQLLEKVKKGTYKVPAYVPYECKELLKGMMEIDPEKRLTVIYFNFIYAHNLFFLK
jgi:BR serine/threonine kinase